MHVYKHGMEGQEGGQQSTCDEVLAAIGSCLFYKNFFPFSFYGCTCFFKNGDGARTSRGTCDFYLGKKL